MNDPTIVITTRNRAPQLKQGLLSIRAMNYTGVDVVVVDDNSDDNTKRILKSFECWPFPDPPIQGCQPSVNSFEKEFYLCGAVFSPDSRFASYRAFRLPASKKYRQNPAVVINFGHRRAKTDIVIEQCAEVCHLTDCVEPLARICKPGHMALARVYSGTIEQMTELQDKINQGAFEFPEDFETEECPKNPGATEIPYLGEEKLALYCGVERPIPFMFLGAIHKSDFEAVGGYNENIPRAADDDLALKLHARRVKFTYVGNAIAFHLKHGKS